MKSIECYGIFTLLAGVWRQIPPNSYSTETGEVTGRLLISYTTTSSVVTRDAVAEWSKTLGFEANCHGFESRRGIHFFAFALNMRCDALHINARTARVSTLQIRCFFTIVVVEHVRIELICGAWLYSGRADSLAFTQVVYTYYRVGGADSLAFAHVV